MKSHQLFAIRPLSLLFLLSGLAERWPQSRRLPCRSRRRWKRSPRSARPGSDARSGRGAIRRGGKPPAAKKFLVNDCLVDAKKRRTQSMIEREI